MATDDTCEVERLCSLWQVGEAMGSEPSDVDPSIPMVVARPQRGGLANRLFPWARAVVHSSESGLPMAPTRWWQVKVGPALRREHDLRLYTGMFAPEPWAVDRPVRAWSRRIVPEPVGLGHEPHSLAKGELIVFRGLADYFDRLAPHRSLIIDRLALVSRLRPAREVVPVVAHVRRGDFPAAWRTEDEWFLGIARSLRAVGHTESIPLFSDGTTEELAPLLEQGFVHQTGGTALEDLWAVANSRILLASGASTFSSWGAFLGSALTIAPVHRDITGLDRWFPERVKRVGCLGPELLRRIEDTLSGVSWE